MTRREVVFGQPSFDEREVDVVSTVIRSCWIGQGPIVEEFEDTFAAYVHASHVVAVSSCSAALELALRVAGVGTGDEVITTPMTFVATAGAIEACGAEVRFVDIEPGSLAISPSAVMAALTDRTKAVLPVSFGGRPIDIHGYVEILDRTGVWLVEDAAHAVGGVAAGQPVGADRHERWLTCFSFYPNKNLAAPEGGAVTTSSGDIAARLRSMRLHGLTADAWDRYRSAEPRPTIAVGPGLKANWTDLQAAIALVQLDKLDGFLATREYLASAYDRCLAREHRVRIIERPPTTLASRHALHLYQVRIDGGQRDAVLAAMRKQGVGAAVHYLGLNLQPRFESYGGCELPNSDLASQELLSLPIHPGLHDDDISYVCDALGTALDGAQVRRGFNAGGD